MKLIPYGIDDFDRIIRDDYYYIDKTRYIKTVEDQNSYILFVRPRRMGKSLFTNMLMSYYDIAKKDQFDSLFGNLWIGKNPTKWANKFVVLKFDFSMVDSDLTHLIENFSNYCMQRINNFFDRYATLFTAQEREAVISQRSAKDALVNLIERCRLKGLHTYLFIDEYDNFSNVVLTSRGVKAHKLITHGEGFYRNFFKAFKGSFERIFMTGVTPVTYDDLTSGFNIADVVALMPQFDKTIGVTETELREMIEYYQGQQAISVSADDCIADMKPWYNNFYFCGKCYGVEPPVYNTDMVMRYIKSLITTGYKPSDMISRNSRTDYDKLNYLISAEDLKNRERRMEIIREICAKGYTTGTVIEQFPASKCGDEENFKSMLYYYGTLTFGGYGDEGETILRVPNKTMGELYLKYMLQTIREDGVDIDSERGALQACLRDAAIDGAWQTLCDMIGTLYSQYSSVRNGIRGEYDVQGFLRGLLCLNRYYDIWPELELGSGYCDILLLPKTAQNSPTKHSYVIEIKYMKANETNVQAYIDKACSQLDRYVADKHLTASNILRGTTLIKIYLVFQGQKLIVAGKHE